MTCEHITETRDGTVLTLTINRPDKKNALTGAMYAALADGINGAQTDPSVRVILLTGAGDMFTAGNDLMDFMNASPDQVSSETSPTTRFLHSLANAEKPLMAAVNGRAIGVGLTMLLHCDLVYMADDAALQAPFVNLALMPEAASSMLLPATVGRAKANAIFMLGEKIDTNTAEELGIVTAVVPG
ncbi:MAG: enoyl-CoA hydratase-related protein, partial [Proteobacteria bacterium]|nr:enoyl-CoA hydratase-related protein [Pseudomonadota bacterium]